MIIYNVTSKVSAAIKDQWLNWLLKVHIPQVMASECFIQYKVVKLLDMDDEEGPTYAVQYTAETIDKYQKYIDEFHAELTQLSYRKWGDNFISFSTIMEVIQ